MKRVFGRCRRTIWLCILLSKLIKEPLQLNTLCSTLIKVAEYEGKAEKEDMNKDKYLLEIDIALCEMSHQPEA